MLHNLDLLNMTETLFRFTGLIYLNCLGWTNLDLGDLVLSRDIFTIERQEGDRDNTTSRIIGTKRHKTYFKMSADTA